MTKLKNKVAVVFAAGGAIAGAVAASMAFHGARVYLSGRDLVAIRKVADNIKNNGGWAEAHQVDALSETQIDDHLKQIVADNGSLDIVFNGIGVRPAKTSYGIPSIALSFDHFMEPMRVHTGSQFLTSRMAAKYMIQTKTGGTILTLTASLSRLKIPFMSGITCACSAIEGLTRVMSSEFGRYGIKVICLNPTALGESRTIQETTASIANTLGISVEEYHRTAGQHYLLGRGPTLKEVGELAALLCTEEGGLLNSHVVDADMGTMAVI